MTHSGTRLLSLRYGLSSCLSLFHAHVGRTFRPPSRQRAACYRELANEMLIRAKEAVSEETRVGLLDIATGWLEIADKLEAEYGEASMTTDPRVASLLVL